MRCAYLCRRRVAADVQRNGQTGTLGQVSRSFPVNTTFAVSIESNQRPLSDAKICGRQSLQL